MGNFIVGFFLGIFCLGLWVSTTDNLVVLSEAPIIACELSLPRTQKCVYVAVPEPKKD